MRSLSILVIEDDADLREGLVFSFSSEGNTVVGGGTKRKGIGKSAAESMILCFWTAICPTPAGLNFAGKCAGTVIYR